MTSVAVIDYGMGNLRSVAKALEHAHAGTRVQPHFVLVLSFPADVDFELARGDIDEISH